MARVIGRDDAQARELLAASGVRLHRAVGDPADAPPDLIAAVLPPAARSIRAEAGVEAPDDTHAGMGAWHVNAVDELHVVRSGEGIMEFITLDGPVAVVVEAGDVIEVRGAEHRYRPLSAQQWVMRWSGDEDADLGAIETGRASDHWPEP
jgi:hypothetical protein